MRLLLDSISWMGVGTKHSQKQMLLCPGVRLQQQELRLGTTLQPLPSTFVLAAMNTGSGLRATQVNIPQGTAALVHFRRCNISVYSTAHLKLILDELPAQPYFFFFFAANQMHTPLLPCLSTTWCFCSAAGVQA